MLAALAFRNPEGDLLAIAIFFAGSAILKGLFEILVHRNLKDNGMYNASVLLVLGLLDIIVGVFLLFNLNASIIVMPYVFAFWFLMDSLTNLYTKRIFRTINTNYYWFNTVVNLLGIVLAVVLIFNPLATVLTIAYTIGLYFMFIGVTFIFESFY